MSGEQQTLQTETAERVAPAQRPDACQQSEMDEEAADQSAMSARTRLDDVALLASLLQRDGAMSFTIAWLTGLATLLLLMAFRMFATSATLAFSMGLCFTLLASLGALSFMPVASRSRSRKRALVSTLEQIQDKQQVGLLIRTLRVENAAVRNVVKKTLIVLLPTLQASDAALIGDEERDILLRLLAIPPNDCSYRDLTELGSPLVYRREADLRLSILKALEQVGGKKEISTVARLSRGLPTLYSSVKAPTEIRDAAKECLLYLEARASERRASEQLLRASSASATPYDALLRAADPQVDDAPERLLRASGPSL